MAAKPEIGPPSDRVKAELWDQVVAEVQYRERMNRKEHISYEVIVGMVKRYLREWRIKH